MLLLELIRFVYYGSSLTAKNSLKSDFAIQVLQNIDFRRLYRAVAKFVKTFVFLCFEKINLSPRCKPHTELEGFFIIKSGTNLPICNEELFVSFSIIYIKT